MNSKNIKSDKWLQKYHRKLEGGLALTTDEAAYFLGTSVRQLENWRKAKIGPWWRYRGPTRVIYPAAMDEREGEVTLPLITAFLPGGITEYYTTQEAAQLLGKSTRTLEKMRAASKGPPCAVVGYRRVLYRKDLLDIAGTLPSTESAIAVSTTQPSSEAAKQGE